LINILDNPELYDGRNLDACLGYCKSLYPIKLNEEVIFHKLWLNKGIEFGRKQALSVKSFIVTQQLDRCKLILWTDYDIANSEYIKPLLPYIEIKYYNATEEAKGTILEGNKNLIFKDSMAYLDGDLFRLLILHKYGGVYSDMDVVLLRDFSPLLSKEFMYGWGNAYNTDGWINGAIMHLVKESLLSDYLLLEVKNCDINSPTSLGKDTYLKVREYYNNWIVYPAGFFNTEWQWDASYMRRILGEEFYEGITSPMRKNKYSNELYDGAFSWHWHNKWEDRIEEGSKFQIIEEIINRKFNESFSSL